MDDEKTVTAWISKYALSSGVFSTKVRISEKFPNMASSAENSLQTFHGSDWHRTKEAALKKAEDMRVKKIDSIKKQLARLQKMDFSK